MFTAAFRTAISYRAAEMFLVSEPIPLVTVMGEFASLSQIGPKVVYSSPMRQCRALKARMSKFQCLRTLVAKLDLLANRICLAKLIRPSKIHVPAIGTPTRSAILQAAIIWSVAVILYKVPNCCSS